MSTFEFANIQLHSEDLEDILDTAGIACSHWANRIDVDGENITVLDEDGFDHKINKSAIEKAFSLIVTGKREVWSEIKRYLEEALKEDDMGHVDGYAADALVQIACFGEIVYN